MQIPYEVQARPDTGLYNAKLGIWLFLASEVMLFGGLFSAYIFLRLGAEPGYWPHGLLNVPIGTFNTAVLIASSVTVIMAWASLKMRNFQQYRLWMAITIACGVAFLGIKLTLEWPPKFKHFGAYIRKDKLAEYEKYLGNEHMKAHNLPPRVEITGHLHEVEIDSTNADPIELGAIIKNRDLTIINPSEVHGNEGSPKEGEAHAKEGEGHEKKEGVANILTVKVHSPGDAEALARTLGKVLNPDEPDPKKRTRFVPGVKLIAFEVQVDQENAKPDDPQNERPHFIPRDFSDQTAKIEVADVDSWSAFVPKHSTYFATYFMITGLHGAHVLAGVLVFCHMFFFGADLYKRNPEHLANRVEVAGLFWHFVDLVWIFVFPLFYLL